MSNHMRLRGREAGVLEVRVRVRCPYCGWKQWEYLKPSSAYPQQVICDLEEGGCDNLYAVRIKTQTLVTDTYELANTRTGKLVINEKCTSLDKS